MGRNFRSISTASRQETIFDLAPSSINQLEALQGASRAFAKPALKPKPPQRTLTGDNGALAAAAKANLDYKSTPAVAADSANNTSSSFFIGSANISGTRQIAASQNPKQFAFITAATLASSRATPRSIEAHNRNNPTRLSRNLGTPSFVSSEFDDSSENGSFSASNMSRPSPDLRGHIAHSTANSQHGTDVTSIATTSSLISQFEQNHAGNVTSRTRPAVVATSAATDIQSPRPLRVSGGNAHPAATLEAARKFQISPSSRSAASSSSASISSKRAENVPKQPNVAAARSQVTLAASRGAAAAARRTSIDIGSHHAAIPPTKEPPKPPLRPKPTIRDIPQRAHDHPEAEKTPSSPSSSEASFTSAVEYRTTKPAPTVPPPRRSRQPARDDELASTSQSPIRHTPSPTLGSAGLPEESLRKAIAQRYRPSSGQHPAPPLLRSSSALDDQSSSSEHGEKRPNSVLRHASPLMSNDSLANAIVASSLAASRAPSPPKATPSPINVPSRHSKTHLPFHRHHRSSESHRPTPSPPKGMRTTMRAPPKEDSEEDAKVRRRHILHKHPNKHHEGDRKRWRDQITERERKRYEGLFASNRGIHVFLTQAEQRGFHRSKRFQVPWEPEREFVSNIVVKDIWHRSRLPDQILEEIWDLVDRRMTGKLTRDEFIVGTWLIDQSLKGRKVPAKVSESVWASIRGLAGVKVPKNK
ncbi:hypothetical protein L228DRAFT_257999 [Xylona heveae TC161]|uniref:EH domain-containing protein n=1 Tax=Xylona heveae (strain CBS 132557 / TC161) TaxID=1328760 RepID=A0A165JT67_XYLHT|nr:hypothetical protein L228DRAFT_257999 [Xylona heveae TC161]KZF26591.1 hypothetical protein L228DRAFT_257999 [Xylona heveae TC161]